MAVHLFGAIDVGSQDPHVLQVWHLAPARVELVGIGTRTRFVPAGHPVSSYRRSSTYSNISCKPRLFSAIQQREQDSNLRVVFSDTLTVFLTAAFNLLAISLNHMNSTSVLTVLLSLSGQHPHLFGFSCRYIQECVIFMPEHNTTAQQQPEDI